MRFPLSLVVLSEALSVSVPQSVSGQLYASSQKYTNCVRVCVQAKVERVVVDGVGRTKDDVIIKEVRPLLESVTFQEVSVCHIVWCLQFCWCYCCECDDCCATSTSITDAGTSTAVPLLLLVLDQYSFTTATAGRAFST